MSQSPERARAVTSAEDAVRLFGGAPDASRRLGIWLRDPARVRVTDYVMQHTVTVPYGITGADVVVTCQQTEHALGEVRPSVGESIPEIRNWSPAFAFCAVHSHVQESLGAPFTWQRYRTFVREDETARSMIYEPACELRNRLRAKRSYSEERIRDALRWRMGNAYYSHLRELYTVVRLRERGLDVRTHPLADALFRVDGWVGDTVIQLYIGNSKYRDGAAGRKPGVEHVLQGAHPALRVVPVRLAAPTRFGRVHLPEESALDRVADEVRNGSIAVAPSPRPSLDDGIPDPKGRAVRVLVLPDADR